MTDEQPFQLGSVNVDSIKNVLHTLANAFPFVDEGAKNAMHTQIETLHLSGDPSAEKVAEDSSEVAALKAQLAEAQAKLDAAQQGSGT